MITVDKTNFENEIINHKGIVLIEFGGVNCPNCHELLPKLEAIESKYSHVKFAYIDSTNNKCIAMNHKIKGIPVVLIIKDGKEIKRFIKQMCEIPEIEKTLNSLN